MIAAALYRRPRNLARRLLKPLLLALNTYRFKRSEDEAYRLLVTRESLSRAEAREYLHQVRLLRQRDAIRGWE
jgi:hypothetical protein